MNKKSYQIQQTREIVYSRDMFECQYPGCAKAGYSNIEMAHLVSKGLSNIKYVKRFWIEKFNIYLTNKNAGDILNHPLNLITSCRDHNSYHNIGNQPQKRDELLYKIANIVNDSNLART